MKQMIKEQNTNTSHGSCWNRFFVDPKHNLRQDYSHDAWNICLNEIVAYFPLKMEIEQLK